MGGGAFPSFFRLSAFPISDVDNDCNFSILTTLASPNPLVLNKLSVGSKLSVKETELVRSLEVVNNDGEVCGFLLTHIRRIISCMSKGVSFDAKIIALNGAECQVLVQRSK